MVLGEGDVWDFTVLTVDALLGNYTRFFTTNSRCRFKIDYHHILPDYVVCPTRRSLVCRPFATENFIVLLPESQTRHMRRVVT